MLSPTMSLNIEKISLLFVLNLRQNLVILLTVIALVVQTCWNDILYENWKVLTKKLSLKPVSFLMCPSNDAPTNVYQKRRFNVLSFCA